MPLQGFLTEPPDGPFQVVSSPKHLKPEPQATNAKPSTLISTVDDINPALPISRIISRVTK